MFENLLQDFFENEADILCINEESFDFVIGKCIEQGIKNVIGNSLEDNPIKYVPNICLTCVSNIYPYQYVTWYACISNRVLVPFFLEGCNGD